MKRAASAALSVVWALSTLSPAFADQPLPLATYKAECPNPPSNGPLFIGQGIPTVYSGGHIDVAHDIHWLSADHSEHLVGYVITGMSGEIVLVPYTTQRIFAKRYKVLAADDYIPLGVFTLNANTLNAALRKKHLLDSPNERLRMHNCFRNVWNGEYPAQR